MKKYKLTPEHEKQLKPWADIWIKNAMSTKGMTDQDRQEARDAVRGLYEAAGLKPPPNHRIVFVPSPFVLRFAGGFAAAIWHLRKNKHTDDATRAATYAATRAATDATTRAATYATNAATRAATDATDNNKYYDFPVASMPKIERHFGINGLGIRCAKRAYNMWQGGNQWSWWCSFLSFFRHIVKLEIDYSKWEHYEKLAWISGPRIMHEKFCMISDCPDTLLVDDENRPHCDSGPFCRWRDGSAIYALHGVYVPKWLATTPSDKLDAKKILADENSEVRMAGIRKMGMDRMYQHLKPEIIDTDGDYDLFVPRELFAGEYKPYLKMVCPSTGKVFIEGIDEKCKNVKEALAWQYHQIHFQPPKMES
jgi:hypothetical protein